MVRKKPEVVVIQIGANDVKNDVKTLDKLQDIVHIVRKESQDTDIAISTVITIRNKDGIANKISSLKRRLKTFCTRNDAGYFENSNVCSSFLGVKGFI